MMKLRWVEYHLYASVVELRAQADVEERGVVEMKERLLAKLPESKLQYSVGINVETGGAEWIDVPTESVPLTLDELLNKD